MAVGVVHTGVAERSTCNEVRIARSCDLQMLPVFSDRNYGLVGL